nr:hypothetical protein [Tanacetum cinerariifolium]
MWRLWWCDSRGGGLGLEVMVRVTMVVLGGDDGAAVVDGGGGVAA